jgi:formate dehydrogenase iron-sulfur subunit
VAALHKNATGAVVYEPERCLGCRYCMMACPFGVPSYEWYSATPRVRKCEMCPGRGEKGPACAEACPAEATITGDRDALIAEAHRRLAAEPATYNPQIYGLVEAGGTDVLYLGPKSPAELGLPKLTTEGPLPRLTWEVLKHVPDVGIFGGVLLGGFWWLTKRKEQVAAEEHENRGEKNG